MRPPRRSTRPDTLLPYTTLFRSKARSVRGKAGLTPFEQRTAQLLDQRLAREHRLAIEQIARQRRDRPAMLHGSDCGKSLIPGRRNQLAAPADIGLVEPLAHQTVDIVSGKRKGVV